MKFVVKPNGKMTGTVRVPGDKSISHRSIIFGSLANGVTRISGFLEAEDTVNTLQAFRQMGVQIEGPEDGRVTINGVGLHGLKKPADDLYLGNSGTSIRLLSGLLSGQSFETVLSGDESLSKRPMKRVTEPLAKMGANVSTASDGTPPLTVKPSAALKGIRYDMPIASAQVKSCLLLAGLYAEGKTTVVEPAPTRDHTERMLQSFGYPVDVDGPVVSIESGHALQAVEIDVPTDISSAAFFMVGAAIASESDLCIRHVGINPTRIGVLNILRQMGADITLQNERMIGGEPVADIRVRASQLKGIHVPEDQVPLAIDEFPVLAVAAAVADGETVITGAEELRVKESDRIQAMAEGLEILGISVTTYPDGMRITGGTIGSGTVQSFGDHRIAMAFAIAGLRSEGTIEIENCANVATSFPTFIDLAGSCGLQIESC